MVNARRALGWLLLCACLIACAAQTRRASFRGIDGSSLYAAGPAVRMRWVSPLFEPFTGRYVPVEQAAPAIDPTSGRIYAGSSRGSLWAIDANDGRRLYRYDAKGAIEARPAVDPARDEVYAPTIRGTLLALKGASGGLRWKAELDSGISQPPLLSEDAVYVVTDEDMVAAFSRADGSVLWRYRRELHEGFAIAGHAGLTLVDRKLITGFNDGTVAAFDSSDGRVLWETDTSVDLEDIDVTRRFVDVDTTPAVVGDVVYVASFSGGLYGLELATGTIRSHEPGLRGVTSVTATPDALFVGSAERGLVCFDLPGMTVRWQHRLPGGAPTPPQVIGSRVYVAESLGALLALEIADGTEVGRLQTKHGFTAPATLDGHRGFALSNAGTIYAFMF